MRGVTYSRYKLLQISRISTHTPHARRDIEKIYREVVSGEFQLTRLMRGVTGFSLRALQSSVISTHTPHARRDLFGFWFEKGLAISTHTPHARRDSEHGADENDYIYNFNSHASCEA